MDWQKISWLIGFLAWLGWRIAMGGENYQATLTGVDDPALRRLLEEASLTLSRQNQDYPGPALFRRRALEDVDRLQQVLRAEGYYDGGVDIQIPDVSVPPGDVLHQAILQVELGPLYRYGELVITYPPLLSLPDLSALGLITGEPARSQPLLVACRQLRTLVQEAGYPLVKVSAQRVVVDHASQRMNVALMVNPGPPLTLDQPEFHGLSRVRREVVERLVPWYPGERYHPDHIQALQQALLFTGLFASLEITLGDQPTTTGRLPVTVRVTERLPRSLSAGLRFHSDQGLGVNLGWRHRDLLGDGEQVDIKGELASQATTLDGRLRKPGVGRPDQNLLGQGKLTQETTDAYRDLSLDLGISLQQIQETKREITGGLAFRLSEVESQSTDKTFGLLYTPLMASWDYSNNLLDPSRGWRFKVDGAPYVDVLGNELAFFRTQLRTSRYQPLGEKLVLAGRLGVGLIGGASRDALPADLRFYGGGAGSIRGYGYQLAGPLSTPGQDPLGGLSQLEGSVELRYGLTQDTGIVAFVDAGSVSEKSGLRKSSPLFIGSGVGVRYATPLGPVRFDLGVPLDARPGIDSPLQVYLSLGQAF